MERLSGTSNRGRFTLTLDTDNKRFTGDVSKVRLESAPGFDKDSGPDIADPVWKNGNYSYYGTTPSAY